MLYVLGIVLFAMGIGVSIAWHELGHFSTARRFGIRVPEFMVGWGRTLFSRRVGETEFGLKVIPIGGYIRMVGMLPPRPGESHGRTRKSGPFQQLIESVRAESQLLWQPGDEEREFWTRSPWKRIVVMAAGPLMNLILAVALLAVSLMAIGTQGTTMTVGMVEKCVVPISAAGGAAPKDCPVGAPPTPAAASGLRPGDVVLSLAGVHYETWEAFQRAARKAVGTMPLVVSRGGHELTLAITPVQANLPRLDDPTRYERAAFIGLVPAFAYQRQGVGVVTTTIGRYVSLTGASLAALPSRVPTLFRQAFGHQTRSQDTPLSVVGVSRLGGEVLGADIGWKSRVSFFLSLLTGVNLSMFLINLLPLPPFDGGQIMAAAWESIRRRLARMRGRSDPGPVDLAKLMPVAYVVGLVFISYSLLVVIADVFNPVKFS